MTKNEIYLQKRLKVMLPPRLVSKTKAKTVRNPLALTAMKNLDSLGYTFSRELYNELCRLSDEEIVGVYNEIVPILKKMKGSHVKHNPMYKNFPKQVLEASDLELYFNAIVHYWTLLMPSYDEENREPLLENHKVDVIDLGSEKDFNSIFTTLLSAKSSISQFDKDIVEWFVKNAVINDLIPSEIPMKENLGLLAGKCMKYKLQVDLSSNVKTATDVLRICAAVSDGDVSLAENCKFTKFSRFERKFILGLLEKCGNIKEDMVKHKNRWIRLGEILHPGEYAQFKKANSAFKALRDDEKIPTFNSKVEASLSNNKIKEATELLATRPGMLARRLDQLIRSTHHKYVVANEFLAVADQVATPVLLQVSQHFNSRDKDQEFRTIFPKGSLAKAQILPNEFEPLPSKVCRIVVNGIDDVLVKRFSTLSKLGNVYVDPNLENYFVPFSQRSASKALKTIVRGSRIPLENDSNTVRFFIWWKNMGNNPWGGRVDIDLSAMLVNEEWNRADHIAYYNLRSFGGHHSGDITNAPDGASEFIDIDLKKCIESGHRYIIMTINSYTQQPFHDLPECFAGWMLRKNANSGEIFEAKTVKNKSDVTGESRMNIPLIIDALERKVIWTDLSLKSHPQFQNNLYANQSNTALLCKAMTQLNKYNLYDLFYLHGVARGKLVESASEADTVFSETEGTTPFDVDKIISEYL